MELEVGSILTGKVVTITKFGAFVSVAPNKSGLVHISEIANTYVNDVNDHLTVGQEVKVKLISIDQAGRLNLSIKQAQENAPADSGFRRGSAPAFRQGGSAPQHSAPAPRQDRRPQNFASGQVNTNSGDASFEDKLKRFMQDSESKMSGSKQYEKKVSRRRGNWNSGDY